MILFELRRVMRQTPYRAEANPPGRIVAVSDFGAGDRLNPPSCATDPGWRRNVYKLVSLRLAPIYGGGFAAMELTTILNRCKPGGAIGHAGS